MSESDGVGSGQEYIEEYPPRSRPPDRMEELSPDNAPNANSPFGDDEQVESADEGSRKRTADASGLPENMTLDEIETAKRSKTEPSMIQHPSGKFDRRGRPIPGMAVMPDSAKPLGDGKEADAEVEKEEQPAEALAQEKSEPKNKIYVGSLPPFIDEMVLHDYFSNFGKVISCQVVRNRETGISRGFAFLTFSSDEEANEAVLHVNHSIKGRQIRVSFAQDNATEKKNYNLTRNQILDTMVLPNQSRVYMGPLGDGVTVNDITKQFSLYGTVTGVSKLKSSETSVKRGFGFVEYREGTNAICRAFGAKVYVKGEYVYVALSRMAMELMLSETVVFFYDAHIFCDENHLEKHFRKYGQVFRAIHLPSPVTAKPKDQGEENIPNRSYGFVDFVNPRAVDSCNADKNQLLHPGQYIRTGNNLPQSLGLEFLAISDQEGIAIKKKLEKVTLDQGSWGDPKKVRGEGITTSQVRIPGSMVSKLIGERGRSIAEITRDSKTKIQIPRTDPSESQVIISITGRREDIRTAQYLMQRLLKGNK